MSVDRVESRGSTEVFRGRLRQALNGNWVFNASTGQNGVVGFMLGSSVNATWSSSESPASGLQVTIPLAMNLGSFTSVGMAGSLNEVIVLTNVIPTDFTD